MKDSAEEEIPAGFDSNAILRVAFGNIAQQRRFHMKYIKQLGIIFGICWLSSIVETLLPFTFPASVIGMLLTLLLLLTKVLKVSHVQDVSTFLLANMTFFFVPVNSGLINYLDILKESWFPLVMICLISTLATFTVTAYTVKFTNKLLQKKGRAER